ncbi:MAG TPA: DEAD/DEAH box helicase [Edaphocola sp.]|nr:DEAD/DEAH box helicase [Edaphocola sp.]
MSADDKIINEILFLPERFGKDIHPFYLLTIDKNSKQVQFKKQILTAALVRKVFKNVSDSQLKALLNIAKENFSEGIQNGFQRALFKSFNKDLQKVYEKVAINYTHNIMHGILNDMPGLRLYHQTKNPNTGNPTYSVAHFSSEKINLEFEVKRTSTNHLKLLTFFNIKGNLIPLDACQVNACYLWFDNCYYTIPISITESLRWLKCGIVEKFKNKDSYFYEQIVKKLERDYPIKRDGIFEEQVVETTPKNCVYLSELGDSMLMISPRWHYEEIYVELPFASQQVINRNGIHYLVKRDQEVEDAFFKYLQSLHPNFQKQHNFFYLSFKDAKKQNWFLKTFHKLLEDEIEILGMELLSHFRYSTEQAVSNFEIVEETKTAVKARFETFFGKEKIKISDIQKILASDQNNILLKDNTIGVFQQEWLDSYSILLKHGRVNQDQLVFSKFLGFSIESPKLREKLQLTIPEEWKEKWEQWKNEEKIYEQPALLNASLRSYQHKGFEWMNLLSEIGAGACLADDMGLGKTVQTLAVICQLIAQKPDAKIMIVCPLTLVFNWESEIKKFTDGIKSYVYNGINRSLNNFGIDDYSILICTYGTVRNDIDQLKTINWDLVVADESQNIKNMSSLSARAILELDANLRIALSGTPILNNTKELYSQMEFLVPGLLGSYEHFKKDYAIPIDKFGEKNKLELLQKIISPFFLKRSKEQVATDLPQKTTSVLWCEMNEVQREAYENIKSQVGKSVFLGIEKSGIGGHKLGILQAILKLRQVCAAPQLIEESDDITDSIKLEVLMEQILNLGDKKTLIFSQFKGMLQIVANKLESEGIEYFKLTGETPLNKRKEMVEQFQEVESDTNIFLISLKAGNAGLNLTAAEYVFLIDPWWNDAVEQQAIDRTHRIGQTKNVFAYKLLCRDTIEEKILLLQQRKAALADDLVQSQDGFVKDLSIEDVTYLFS